MKRSIRSIKDLPTWFDLRKYECATQFNLANWVAAFEVRHMLIGPLYSETISSELSAAKRTEAIEHYHGLWRAIQEAGAYAGSGSLQATREVVRHLTVLDHFRIDEGLTEHTDYRRRYEEHVKELNEAGSSGAAVPETLHVGVHTIVNPDNLALAVVDLNATNHQICDAFLAWLTKVRDHDDQFRTRRYSRKDCSLWFQSSVLPYLDLSHWAETEGVSIPDWLMGEAIFPPDREINVAETVRKTTRPLANRVLSGELLKGLALELRDHSG